MPAITVGFPEFESRLDQIRRRMNRLALLDASCSAAAALLLAASLLIFAAFAFSPQVFAWTLRATTGVAAIAVGASAWWLHRRWLDLYDTALHVDRRADMDARVSTMLAHPKSESRSAMRSLLLWQIFDRSSKWDIGHVAPLRVGRPAIAAAIALLIFLATVVLVPQSEDEPPPEMPAEVAARAVGKPALGKPDRGGAADSPLQGETAGALGAGGEQAAPGNGEGRRGEEGDATASKASTKSEGDPRNDHPDPGRLPDDKLAAAAKDRPQALEPAAPPPPGVAAPKAPAPTEPRRADSPEKADRRSEQRRPRSDAKGGSKAAGAAPRKGKTGGTRGLLSEKAIRPLAVSEETKPMVIQLKAFAVKPADQLEQQGKPSGEDGADAVAEQVAPAEIAGSQSEDSPLQRSVVTRAHQDLIRGLFTPDESEPGSPE